jgi:hypothetical protein
MRHWLVGEPRIELTQGKVCKKCKNEEPDDTAGQVEITHEDDVSDSPHGAESGSLGENSYEEGNDERYNYGRVLRPGPFALKKGAPPGTIGLIIRSSKRPTIMRGIMSPVNL